MVKKLEGAGLRGQVAGETSLSTVGQIEGLAYRGHKVETLAEKATFEEVAYLLLYNKLPNKNELAEYKALLKSQRDLPQALKEVLQKIPATAHPMDVMRTGTSMLGNLEPEGDFSNQLDSINRMIATMASIVTYWYKYSHDGEEISLVNDEDSMAGHFLHILHGKAPSDLHRKVMDVSLVLYAEHEFNASTFTGRVCASTMSDIHSCVVAAIGSLRGPLHGGANEKAMELIENWTSREEAKVDTFILSRLCYLLGQVALCQLNYLDVNLFNELKRRNYLREQKAEMDKKQKVLKQIFNFHQSQHLTKHLSRRMLRRRRPREPQP